MIILLWIHVLSSLPVVAACIYHRRHRVAHHGTVSTAEHRLFLCVCVLCVCVCVCMICKQLVIIVIHVVSVFSWTLPSGFFPMDDLSIIIIIILTMPTLCTPHWMNLLIYFYCVYSSVTFVDLNVHCVSYSWQLLLYYVQYNFLVL